MDYQPIITAALTAVTVVGILYRVVLLPNLDRRYQSREACKVHSASAEELRANMAELKAVVMTLQTRVELMSATLERLADRLDRIAERE